MKKVNTSFDALLPLLKKIEEISKTQRILIYCGSITILIAVFVYLSFLPKLKQLRELKINYGKNKQNLVLAKKNAVQSKKFKDEMRQSEKDYRRVTRALPEKEEIPDLLAGISNAGRAVGLEFLLFQPQQELKKDFYAEIPVSIQLSGNYHNVGLFFDKVSNLSRIVNIKAIKMSPLIDSDQLITSCSAVTYKFIDEKLPDKPGKNKK